MEKRSVSMRTGDMFGPPTTASPRSRSAERTMMQVGEGISIDLDGEQAAPENNGSLDEEEPELPPQADTNRQRTSSSSSLTKQVRSHRRAMSDPFDTADMDGITDGDNLNDSNNHTENHAPEHRPPAEESDGSLPTLARFPFAETNNQNCWSEPAVDIFSVRGPEYLDDKKKVTATRYLLPARGCDLFLSDDPGSCKLASSPGILGGKLRTKPSLLIRLTFPWGMLIQYYEVPQKYADFMRSGSNPSMDEFSPGEQAFAMWLAGDADYRNERLKLISYVPEGPWLVRNMVTGKPAIIGKKLPVKYTYTPRSDDKEDFLECDLDIGSSSKTAKRIVSVCRRYMACLTVDIGFVIEGKTAEELPEEMMGAIRIHEIDPIKAPTIQS